MSFLIPMVLIVLNHFSSSTVALVPGYTSGHGSAHSLLSLLINHHYNFKLTVVKPDNESFVVEAKPPLGIAPVKQSVQQEKLSKSRQACAKFMNINIGGKIPAASKTPMSEPWSVVSQVLSKLEAQVGEHFRTRLATRTDTLVGEYSHLAALGSIDDNGDFIHRCAGTIIEHNWILTAAHCTQNSSQHLTTVRLGVTNLQRNNTDGVTRGITQIFRHPSYRPYYDIALLKLDRPVNFDSTIKPACLQTSDDFPKTASMTGWTTELGGSRPEVSQKAQVTVVDHKWCLSEMEHSVKYPYDYDSAIICGVSPKINWRNDTCQGYSGGPLHIQLSNQETSVIGVSSFDIDCKSPGSPKVFSKVSYFIQWIENIVWPDSDLYDDDSDYYG